MVENILQLNWTPLKTIDFVEGGYDDVRNAFLETRKTLLKNAALWKLPAMRHWAGPSQTLREKVELVMPIVRPGPDKLLVSEMASSNWCFAIANSQHGIGPTNDAKFSARLLKARHLRIVAERAKGLESIQFIFSDYSKRKSGTPEPVVRIVYVHHEGGWKFFESGEALPFENIQLYQERRKRDRLTLATIADYCRHLGVDLCSQDAFAGRYEIIEYPSSPNKVIVEKCI